MVDSQTLGELARLVIRCSLGAEPYRVALACFYLRKLWADIEPYHQRQIICDIEVELICDRERNEKRLPERAAWESIVKDLRPPKAAYTVDYRCDKCKTIGVKLWRGVHGHTDDNGHALLCATCVAPGVTVSGLGTAPCVTLGGQSIAQINGWLPAVPVDDTYWGYSSVPSADVEWWQALPTYPAVPK